MSAFTDLLQFATELTPTQSKRFLDLLSAHITEEQRQVNILLADTSAVTKPFEVVAVAGTAETLLTDVTDTNVGEIKAKDIVYFVENGVYDEGDLRRLKEDRIKENEPYKVDRIEYYYNVPQVCIGKKYIHPAKYFRKIQTPIINPLNTVEGC